MLHGCDAGSWDSSARLWDPRAPPGQNCACIIGLPGKVFTMAQSQSRLVIGTSGRHVMIYDIRRSVLDGLDCPSEPAELYAHRLCTSQYHATVCEWICLAEPAQLQSLC